MRLSLTIFFFVLFSLSGLVYAQKADHVVIAEVYGGGGNSGAYYKYDYIILYNPTSSSVDLSTWSVQYASSSSSNWHTTNLTGTIQANSYYGIQGSAGSNSSAADLPFTPNDTGTFSLSATSDKVALVDNQTDLAVDDPTSNSDVIDFVGYGNADAYEGSAAASSPSNTESIRRLDNSGNQTYGSNGSGWDSDDNANDFYVATTDNTSPPLPVELSTFTAKANKLGIQLNWSTATEVNNYGFEIQRSVVSEQQSAESWVKVGFVKGNGNSSSPKSYSFVDNNPLSGKVEYRLKQIDNDGQYKYSNIVEVSFSNPLRFALFQNYPNPFNPSTIIKYQISKAVYVSLKVYDVLGRRVASLVNKNEQPGNYSVRFNAEKLSSGIYYYQLKAGNYRQVKKLLLLK
jgi:Lamin Tail Domain/Secretion system C-terminal sorting domain